MESLLNVVIAMLLAVMAQFGIDTTSLTSLPTLDNELVEFVEAAQPAPPASTALIVEAHWESYHSYFSDEIDRVKLFATVTNNTGQTLDVWGGSMECTDADGRIVANASVTSAWGGDVPALAHGESAKIEFHDYSATGEPTECDLVFEASLDLSWSTPIDQEA